MLGGWQWRQINVQPEPAVSERVAQGPTFAAKERLAALPQLTHMGLREAVQRPGQRCLGRKLRSPPGLCQGKVGSQARVDLIDGATAGQDADQHIKQLGGGRMLYSLERHGHRPQNWSQKARPHHAVADNT